MTVKEIREKARNFHLKGAARLAKDDLIRAVQLAEGNTDCWQRVAGCAQDDCCWHEECQDGLGGGGLT